MGGLQVTLAPAEASDLITSIETVTTVSGEGGAFTFAAVPAGQYTLRATRSPRMMAGGGGETTTIAQGGAVMVTRMVRRDASARCPPNRRCGRRRRSRRRERHERRVDHAAAGAQGHRQRAVRRHDAAADRTDQLPNIGVTLELADVRPGSTANARGRIEPSGAFATMGVPPGRYFVRVAGAPQGWTFRGATLGGRDVTDAPLDIDGDVSGVVLTFTDRQTQLCGKRNGGERLARRGDGDRVSDGSRRVGRLRQRVEAPAHGTRGQERQLQRRIAPARRVFRRRHPERMAADWQNPKFLEGLTGDATRVRLADGDKRTLSVKVAR